VDADGTSTALVTGDAQVVKGDGVDADGTSTALVTGDAQTTKGDGVAADGTDVQVAVGSAETTEGDTSQADGIAAPLVMGEVQMEGPWEPPWRPEDRSLSSLDAAFDPYPADPYFYLRFDEPHGVPKRLKDNWQRGTEATYWDGEQLQTAAAHEPRIQTDPETGERYLLAEPQRQNPIPYSSAVNKSNWDVDKIDSSPSVESILDSELAYEVFNGSNGPGLLEQYSGSFSGENEIGYILAEQGTANKFRIKIKTSNSGNFWLDYRFDTDSTILANGDVIDFGREIITESGPNGGRVILLWVKYGPENGYVSGETRNFRFYPSLGSNVLSTVVHHTQIEVGKHYTTPVVTGSSGSTRAADDPSNLPIHMKSGAKSVYFRIEQEANAYDPNEGGNITNAEVNLGDSPGTAGDGLLRPSTGIVGVAADGIVDAVVNTSDEDLQGNATSDGVDTLVLSPDKDPSTDGAIYRIHELVAWEEERTYDERRSLTGEHPQPWQELDAPNINTLDTLNGDIDWSNFGISEPPHLNIDIPRFGVPAKMRSAWQRDTEATYWDSNGVLQTAQPGEPRLARTYDGSQWKTEGVLAEPQRTNLISRDLSSWANPGGRDGAALNSGKTGIDGTNNAWEVYDSDGGGDAEYLQKKAISSDSTGYSFRLFLKKGQGNPFDLIFILKNEGIEVSKTLDPTTDLTTDESNGNGRLVIEEVGDWWEIIGTVNNNGNAFQASIQMKNISGSSGNGIIVDAPQIENHHAVATDANGHADATHATMPILTGGATRSEDKLVMPVWWEQGVVSGGYVETRQEAGGVYTPGGGNVTEALLRIGSSKSAGVGFGYDHGLADTTDGTDYSSGAGADGVVTQAANNNDGAQGSQDVQRLYMLPDRTPSNVSGVRHILRRLYLWPQELTEGSGGQLESLFNHDFSV
jgi:hypothetical protein